MSGAIPAELPPNLSRLGLPPETWLDNAQHFSRRFGGRWLWGKRASALLYPDPSPA